MHRSETLTEEQLGRLKFVQGSGLMVRPGMFYNVHFVDKNNYEKVEKLFKSYADITELSEFIFSKISEISLAILNSFGCKICFPSNSQKFLTY